MRIFKHPTINPELSLRNQKWDRMARNCLDQSSSMSKIIWHVWKQGSPEHKSNNDVHWDHYLE